MNVAEVIDMTRKTVLMDAVVPYLWGDDELIYMLNRAMNEIFRISAVKDQTTTAIVQIKLLSNLGVYPLDSRVLKIDNARLSTNSEYGSLVKNTEERLNKENNEWRDDTGTPIEYCPVAYSGYLSIHPKFDDVGEYVGDSDISFVSSGGIYTISQTNGDFSDLTAGDQVVVTGSGVTANNTTLTVVTVGTDSFTVSESITSASGTSATIRLVRDTLLLSVSRFGTAYFVVSDIENETEITDLKDQWAETLVDGIAKRAYLKPHTQTLDSAKAESHRQLFELAKKDIKRDIILLHKPDKSRVPRSGTSIYY